MCSSDLLAPKRTYVGHGWRHATAHRPAVRAGSRQDLEVVPLQRLRPKKPALIEDRAQVEIRQNARWVDTHRSREDSLAEVVNLSQRDVRVFYR